jgi:hypothetical protein
MRPIRTVATGPMSMISIIRIGHGRRGRPYGGFGLIK